MIVFYLLFIYHKFVLFIMYNRNWMHYLHRGNARVILNRYQSITTHRFKNDIDIVHHI